MNSQKIATESYCVGGKHRSGTKNITGETTINKKTGREIKFLVSKCVICNRKKSMIVSDNTIQAEGLGSFFKNLGKGFVKVVKNLAKNVLKNPRRAFEIGAIVGAAFATRSAKATLSSLPGMINFYHTGKGLYLGKFVNFISYKWNKKVIDSTQVHH